MSEHLEGKQCILSALRARQRRFEIILVSWSAHRSKTEEVIQLANQLGVPVKIAPPDELDKMSRGKTHAGLLAVASAKPLTRPVELLQMTRNPDKPPFFLLLEGIEDEQNLGFILRTAGAMGVGAVMLKKHIWNFDSRAVSRASAGVYEWMPLVKLERESDLLSDLKKAGLRVLGALPRVRRNIYEMDFKAPVIVALGGEKRGLSGALRQACTGFFTIPMPASAKGSDRETPSLSLSHSGAIVMAEVMRQRRAAELTKIIHL